ncbi:hypothetical protein L9F63_019391, partial [Diploptera punctata]
DYEVLTLLGKGGFASVYRARCKKTRLGWQLKWNDKSSAPGGIIHSRLKHPSILELYTFFEDTNYVYLVLELCHNGELQRYLKRKAIILSEESACSIFHQVVQGLVYLHSHKILHRDLSLSNLLLSKDMQVVTDFGLATQLSSIEEKHLTMCGTPNYISPEVASRSSHGLEADVWGLGCMLYTLLVGKPPFDTDGVKSTLTKVVMANYEVPTGLSPAAKDLIDLLLKKNPKERIKLQNILDHPFMKLANTNKFLPQKTDSGMGTMSTGAHSRTKVSFQTETDVMPSHHSCPTDDDDNVSPILQLTEHFRNVKREVHRSTYRSKKETAKKRHNTGRPEATDNGGKLRNCSIEEKGYEHKHCSIGDTFVVIMYEIITYKPNNGRGCPVRDSPPVIPEAGADAIYSFESLPEKHKKKYMYASRFVSLVKAKTPKVTLYSDKAKCLLMENSPDPDFETLVFVFLIGGKISKSRDFGVKIINKSGQSTVIDKGMDSRSLPAAMKLLWNHFEQCYKHCCLVEQTLSQMSRSSDDGMSLFPIIVGRRPYANQSPAFVGKENVMRFERGNTPITKFDTCVLNSAIAASSVHVPCKNTSVKVNGIGVAEQLASGEIRVYYEDGSILTVNSTSGAVEFQKLYGKAKKYSQKDVLPDELKFKLTDIPKVSN